MPSFDVEVKADAVELRNAVDQAQKEIGTRYDFRGTKASVEQKDLELYLVAESDFQLRQVRDVLIGKLAKRFADDGKSVLLAAGDTFRAPAREQLAVWGERNRVEVISQTGGDPAAVVFDAVSAGRARGMDVVIADTAGRLPTQTNLMEELGRIRRSQEKAMEGAPHEVILVVDGTNGQNALAQVRAFDLYAHLTGLFRSPHRHQA